MAYQFVTILGFGISSIGTIRFLLKHCPGTRIRVSDLEPRESFDQELILDLIAGGVEFEFGKQTREFISFDGLAENHFVMISPGIPPVAPIIQMIKTLDVESGTDFDLALKLGAIKEYIAVTGTNGKTTTTSLIAHLLETEALGNIGKAFMTIENNARAPVCELSSFQLFYCQALANEKYWPKVSVYLNMTDDHLDWHSSLEEYQESKAKLFNVSNQINNSLIFNYDDLILKDLSIRLAKQMQSSASLHTNIALFSVEQDLIELSEINSRTAFLEDGILYLVKYLPEGVGSDDSGLILPNPDGNYICKIPVIDIKDLNIVGKHNYSNVLAAILATDAMGLDVELIADRLKTFQAFPHRLEYITEINGHAIYNDSKATNPDSTIKALESFEKSIIILGGKEKNLDLNKLIDVVIDKAFAVVCFGQIGSKIQQLLLKQHFTKIVLASTLPEVLNKAIDFAKESGNLSYPILFSPATSSFDMFTGYEDRGDQFRRIVLDKAQSLTETIS